MSMGKEGAPWCIREGELGLVGHKWALLGRRSLGTQGPHGCVRAGVRATSGYGGGGRGGKIWCVRVGGGGDR